MPLLSPPRYQGPLQPAQREEIPAGERTLTTLERMVKGPLFGCRMCGNCILQETAYVCPMTCPKGMRNGLCGGATPEACEVDSSRPCTWYKIYERAEQLGMEDKLLEINAPLDGSRTGRETWLGVLKSFRQAERPPRLIDLARNPERFKKDWEAVFRPVRQPVWWNGDADYHPPAYEGPISALQAALDAGNDFVITTEITPPRSATPTSITRKVEAVRQVVTAINFTDNAAASPRMSSLASSLHCLATGVEPIYQIQTRDRNRAAIQADAIGAASHGIRNILCLTGDHQRFAGGPYAIPHQFDLDSIQLLWLLRRMRDEGVYLDGRSMKTPPKFFLGAAASPFHVTLAYEALRTEKKINAGAQFLETQPVFDVPAFEAWLEALDKRNLLGKVHILAGLAPLKTMSIAQHIHHKVPGITIPAPIMRRMEAAGDDPSAQAEVGFEIAAELLCALRGIAGIRGVHIMAIGWEAILPELVRAGCG
jgi:methylenetetrahydrofolate reductase (NADPH)